MKQTYHLKSILLLTGLLLLIPYWCSAQSINYAYDNAGNRVSRTLDVGPQQAAVRHDNDSVIYHEVLSNKEISLYPNPVKTNLTVNVKGYDSDVNGEYYIFDIQGKMMLHHKMNSESFQIDMSAYASGNYIMRIVLDGESTTWKVIKK
ncbi:MAG: hypothetical protein H6Q20_2613 [Bacteroidetes bacterium]|nr:hypothetical protein [Bacteroidota bacterium]